ncbi:MAG: DUF4251 domain-containing protein [Chitinophagaceae bacterium]
MKKNRFLFLLVATVLSVLLKPATSLAQNNKDSVKIAAVTALVNNQEYTFKAQSAVPLSGRLRQLNSDYGLQVSKAAVVSQLPYFGRAYSAPLNPQDGGIQFTSKDFDYTISNKKKGGWNISIKPKDSKDVTQMQLSIFNNGTASLQVTSNNRQSISFNGYITASAASR